MDRVGCLLDQDVWLVVSAIIAPHYTSVGQSIWSYALDLRFHFVLLRGALWLVQNELKKESPT
jgi:hypothetical protein